MKVQDTETQVKEPAQKKRKRGFLNSLVMFFNHVAAIGLFISYLAPHVSPVNFWMLAFFGLAYPFLVIANLLFVLYWAILRKRALLYSLLVVLLGWFQLREYVQLSAGSTPDKGKKNIKIMSYNVRGFDIYNWKKDKSTRLKIFETIGNESPDIICIQEFYTADSAAQLANLDTMQNIQKAINSYVHYTTVKKKNYWGNATFSFYPIVGKGDILFEKSKNLCIYTDIKINTDTVRVYNVHLESIHLGAVEQKFIDDVMNNKETEEIENSKNIIRRLKRAFIKRAEQTELVAEHIENSPYPVIVCGDFNDPPASYAYHTISENLLDAFVESGNGFGQTYVGNVPPFRIDYILHSDKYKAKGFRTIREKLSDHYPLSCYLEIQ